MMGVSQTPNPPLLYPQALQLKLYQAFIFSIPILFSIILFLFFYLFYLKRRASSFSSSAPILPISTSQAPTTQFPAPAGLKGDLINELPKVIFDEEFRAGDTLCCVCLGEYEKTEELVQVPSCRHVFHKECMRHWLHSNATCPLCRSAVLPVQLKPPTTACHHLPPATTLSSDASAHVS